MAGKKRIGKRTIRKKRVTASSSSSSEDFSRGDFSRQLAFTQAGMDARNNAQERAVEKGMTRLLGPVPKGKSLGT